MRAGVYNIPARYLFLHSKVTKLSSKSAFYLDNPLFDKNYQKQVKIGGVLFMRYYYWLIKLIYRAGYEITITIKATIYIIYAYRNG